MIELSRVADDKKAGMSLGDVRAFLDEADRAGLPDGSKVQAEVGFKAQLRKLKVQG
jgi:hypothetical protein